MQQGYMGPGVGQPMMGMPAPVPVPGTSGQPGAMPAGPPHLQQKKPKRRVLTSLALQIFLFFGGWWDVFYYILNILVFVYKGVQLPYPNRNFAMEFSFAWLWFLIEAPRLFLASKGNKTERAGPILFSFVLAAPLIAMYIYFVNFQTYVLKIDRLLNIGALILMGVQLLFSILAILRFVMTTRFQ